MSIYSYVSSGLEYLYQSAMEYLNETYHQYTSDLHEIPMSEVELADQSYYASLAADTADNYYRAQAQQAAANRGYNRVSGRAGRAADASGEIYKYSRASYPPEAASAGPYDPYTNESYESSTVPIGKLVI